MIDVINGYVTVAGLFHSPCDSEVKKNKLLSKEMSLGHHLLC